MFGVFLLIRTYKKFLSHFLNINAGLGKKNYVVCSKFLNDLHIVKVSCISSKHIVLSLCKAAKINATKWRIMIDDCVNLLKSKVAHGGGRVISASGSETSVASSTLARAIIYNAYTSTIKNKNKKKKSKATISVTKKMMLKFEFVNNPIKNQRLLSKAQCWTKKFFIYF